MARYVTELIGTFFLVLTIGLVIHMENGMAPIAIGAILTALVYAGGHVSGAHYNPAITLAFWFRGTFEAKHIIPYIMAQVAGSLAAAGILVVMTSSTFAPTPGPDTSALAFLLAELLFTFALALVILHVATADATQGNGYYGVAIGFTVAGGAYAVGPISGAAFNPAVGIGPTVVHALSGDGTFDDLWFYIVGPCVGAMLAVPVFMFQTRSHRGTKA